MILIIESREDDASLNICARLRELVDWRETGVSFEGSPILRHDRFIMATIPTLHIFREHVDEEVTRALDGSGLDFSHLIFASKHKSAAGVRALTAHPIGNYSAAEAGGEEGKLAPAPVALLAPALREMRKLASEAGYAGDVTFEVTHHGPYVETPAMFIEVGSSEQHWSDPVAGRVVAKTILSLGDSPSSHPVAVGVGGGHYAPRQVDVALKRKVAFGHLVPNYALDARGAEAVAIAVSRTEGCSTVHIDRKSISGKLNREIQAMAAERGIKIVKSDDFEVL